MDALLPAQHAVFVKDREGRYLMVNAVGAANLGQAPEDLVGRTDVEIFPGELGRRLRRTDEEIMATGEPRTVEEPVIVAGRLRTYLSTKAPLRDPSGDVIGLIGASTDVTALREADEEVRRWEAHLAEAQALAGIGSWEWDVRTGQARWSEQHYRILGRDPAELEASFDNYMECIHPDDRVAVARMAAEVTQPGSSGVGETEYRIVRPDGEERIVHARGRVFFDADGTALRMLGAVEDITERRRNERELQERARREALVSSIGRIALGGEDIRAEVSRALEAELGVSAVEVLEKPHVVAGSFEAAALAADDPVEVPDWSKESRFEQPARLARRGAAASVGLAIRSYRGTWGTLAVHAMEPREFDASELWLLESLSRLLGEAMEHARAGEEMRVRALQDPLTGLANRTLLHDRLRHALGLASRRGSGLAVLFVDLDGFKVINDELGHTAGDAVLTAAAERLRGALRSTDTVARLGGDEFVAVCEDMPDETAALQAAERVRSALAEPFAAGGKDHRLSASVGLVLASGRHKTPDDIVGEADRAMYAAKEQGRDRVVVFSQR